MRSWRGGPPGGEIVPLNLNDCAGEKQPYKGSMMVVVLHSYNRDNSPCNNSDHPTHLVTGAEG